MKSGGEKTKKYDREFKLHAIRLAEEIGIHIGDGNLYISKDKDGFNHYRYRIDGNFKDELIYHEDFIQPLVKKLYNCKGYSLITNKKNSIQSVFNSKMILQYKNRIFGLPIGSKKSSMVLFKITRSFISIGSEIFDL